MPCDTRLKPGQTITQRKTEIKTAVSSIETALTTGTVKLKLSPTGAIAFQGISESARSGVTDACIYRRIMSTGTASAKLAIARAEALAGIRVNQTQVATGVHGHFNADGGITWHNHKG